MFLLRRPLRPRVTGRRDAARRLAVEDVLLEGGCCCLVCPRRIDAVRTQRRDWGFRVEGFGSRV